MNESRAARGKVYARKMRDDEGGYEGGYEEVDRLEKG